MASHDYVVRRIKTWHEQQGDEVTADLPRYDKPPKSRGSRGRAYIPDVFVFNSRLAYEVKEYWAYKWAVPKLKALVSSLEIDKVILVLCTDRPEGVPRVERFLADRGVECEVTNYRELAFW